ncbi:hypothetical protein HX045_06045 [Myroides odoratimimus]|uniref:Uncharacterized protein n=2 Tax=Myroides odoratimimus TaxID=76832 RepID=A0ABN0E9D9_9FLAO|nr:MULTISPECIES: hypothetical protein [Myroides]AJA69866.1 hypothetical protein MYRA21_2757 [Myroides sp. A21]EHO08539.1 hypothetical protein HMPREF9712_02201 [Myroides odoratimimus CCUG 10230]EHO09985.1 hypothetical protein HMPREF9714_01670 [Myroides odoratimimus CCUG 12901]EHO12560.1 hypothetical protein HMPREF9715_01715 [Myroides odoratimimus CIP 101113]EKB07083.1 hypothetical protein HMPREF9711_00393 [Myroides odoratimimus CCUG 3837]
MKPSIFIIQIITLSVSIYFNSLAIDYLIQYIHTDLDHIFGIALGITVISSIITLLTFTYFIWGIVQHITKRIT